MSTPEEGEQVTWIGRERPAFDRITPETPVHALPRPSGPIERIGAARPKWLVPAGVALLVLLIVAAVLWRVMRPKPAIVPLAQQHNIPLISVMTPGLKPVTSTVTFTGAVFARYDMPIGNDGDTGRIVAL